MLLAAKSFLIVLCLQAAEHQAQAQSVGRKIYVYFDAIDCSYYNPHFVESLQCWLVPNRRGQLVMNAVIKLKQDLNNIFCKFQFFIEMNNKNQTFLSTDMDICSAMGTAFKNPVQRLISEEVHRISNFPYECPFKKGVEYAIQNFTLFAKYIPPFIPPMRWSSHSDFRTDSKKHKLFEYETKGQITHTAPIKKTKT